MLKRLALVLLLLSPAAAEDAWSPYGAQEAGLQCRVRAPSQLEHNQPLRVTFELRADPSGIPMGMTHIQGYRLPEKLSISLRCAKRNKTFELRAPLWFGPPPPHDPRPLKGKVGEWRVVFHLVKLHKDLRPGRYTCTVRLASRGGRGEWKGTVASGSFPLTIVAEPRRTQVLLLPKRLRLRPKEVGKRLEELSSLVEVTYTKADAERVVVPLRNGYTLRTLTWYPGAMGLGPVPRPGVVDSVLSPGEQAITIRMEVYESMSEDYRFWAPPPGTRPLWSRSFTVSLSPPVKKLERRK